MLVRESSLFFRCWVRFAKWVTRIYFRRIEIQGDNQQQAQSGIIYCANHVNALVDPAIIQACTPHVLRPLARSGLFNSAYKPFLNLMGAIPIFRVGDKDTGPSTIIGSRASQNQDSFRKVHELLAQNENVVIFPEGQSHSESHLTALKSGAARIAIGALSANKLAPLVIPVGLNFSHKGRFRADILVNFGAAISIAPFELDGANSRQTISQLTKQIESGLQAVTLNTLTWQDMRLVRLLERFFAMRRGKNESASLGQRFKGMQRIIKAQRILREHAPDELRLLTSRLRFFERICSTLGIQSYHLDIEYRPAMIFRFIVKSLLVMLLALPIALVGAINGLVPYYLSGLFVSRFAKGLDQVDTARILFGLLFFGLFWGLQSAWLYTQFGLNITLIVSALLVFASMITLYFRKQLFLLIRNAKVFITFARKRQLKQYVKHKRTELVVEVAKIVKLANELMRKESNAAH